MRRRNFLLLTAAIPLVGCGANNNPLGSPDGSASASPGALTVGSANFTESMVLAELYAQAITGAGLEASAKHGIGSREVYLRALQDQSIDIVPEYSGNLLQYFDADNPATSPEAIAAALGEVTGPDLAVLEASKAANQDVYCVTRAYADTHQLASIGDLTKIAADAVLGGPAELKERPYGPPGLEGIYGVVFKEFRTYDALAVKVKDLTDDKIQVATFFTTDAAIGDNDLVMLEDPQLMILPQQVIPLVRAEVAKNAPVVSAINAVQEALTTADLTALNKQVDTEHANPKDVAAEWLTSKNLS